MSLSSMFSSSSGAPMGQSSAAHTFSLRPSPQDSTLTLVHPAGYPADAPPLYTVAVWPTEPNVRLFRGEPYPSNVVGDATFGTYSSKTKLTLHGQSMQLKTSQMTGDFSLEYTRWGKLKWKLNKITGSGMELFDNRGVKLAKIRSNGMPGFSEDKTLEIYVPCDEFFVDMVVLSGISAKASTKTSMDAVGEVVAALVGA